MSIINTIWKGVIKGDRSAQKALYEYSCDDLMNVCKRYLTDSSSHLDAIQDTYLKIFTKCKSYNPDKGDLSAWMARIAVNECLHQLRKQKRLVLLDVVSTSREPVSDETITAQLSAEEIYNKVAQLPLGYRTVFNLFVVEGYSHKEIGEMLHISPSSSRSQLSRAKTILKKNIKKKTNLVGYEKAK